MGNKVNIKDYFEKGTFVVPEYQRGYKWSVKESNKESSLEVFIESLINAFDNKLEEYFIEAVTVVVKDIDQIILVDGQQRTTSLFLLFIALNDPNFVKGKLDYKVREDSHKWLNNQVSDIQEKIEDEEIQDIYYFKVAQEQIEEKLKNIDKAEFLSFIKSKVFLLYNSIPENKAVNTFIALNGLKAIMKQEELIKSDLLIKSSRLESQGNTNDKEELYGIEWKISEDRGRLARNWDKWLYWWNQEAVKSYFGISNEQHPLYYLLVTYLAIKSDEKIDKIKDTLFDIFKKSFIGDAKSAKLHLEGLRKLQKSFEDLYNNYESHNFLGIILKTSNSREESLCYFLDSKNNDKMKLEDYAKWSLVEAKHLEIINNTTRKIAKEESDEELEILIKRKKALDAINLINEKYVYWDDEDVDFKDRRKENAFRFLLLLNLLEDNKLNRKFDFTIWGNRSLEHIYPKSKKSFLDFDDHKYVEGSIHCIGNLVLLYGWDNSSFGAKDFSEKKITYFNTSDDFRSRNLLHTISVFAKSDWTEVEIITNKISTINQLKKYYGIS